MKGENIENVVIALEHDDVPIERIREYGRKAAARWMEQCRKQQEVQRRTSCMQDCGNCLFEEMEEDES